MVDLIHGIKSETRVYNPGRYGLAHPMPVDTTPIIIIWLFEVTINGPPLSACKNRIFKIFQL